MQGTVATYDEASRSGTVFLDDGTRLSFEAKALEGTGLRHLRPGQRVRLEADGSTIRRIQILTLT
jgi:2-phospho-L-lactate guanylyltransferase